MLESVLLIDDDDVSLFLCEFIMERYGFAKEVIKFNNGQEGINFFENYLENKSQNNSVKLPALIFLDLNMPVLNGWDFLDDFYVKFPELLPNTKVVILSSTIDPEDIARSSKYDIVVDFINKPLNDSSINSLRNNPKLQPLFIKNDLSDKYTE